jgi:UTP--glucose-1-phosphate uridylyltransferase
MHVLTATVMEILEEMARQTDGTGRIHLSSALARTAASERYLAAELAGRRYDIGLKYGLLTAQLALALSGQDRDEVLTDLVGLLSQT